MAVLIDDVASIKEDRAPNPVTGNVLANDIDASSVTSFGTFTMPYGTLVLAANGDYSYTLDNTNPSVQALGDGDTLTDAFIYNVFGDFGTLTITIQGTPENEPPVVAVDTASVKENTAPNPITGNVLSNDSDPDGNTLSVTNGGTFTLTYGVLELHADGTYSYTLDNTNPVVNALNDGQHLTDSFTYSVSDGHGGTNSSSLTVTINGTTDNRPPVVEADVNSVKEDTAPNPITGNVLTNDSDPDGNTLSVTNAGTFNLGHGVLVIHADGTYTYTLDNANPAVNALNDGQHLTDSFTYSVSDGHGGTNSSSLTVTINGTTDNRPPVVEADVNSVKEDTAPNPISGNVLTNDSDPDGNTLSVTNGGTFALNYGVLVINANGTYTYTLDNTNPVVNALNDGQHLTDSFTYSVSDGHGGTNSSSLTVTINGTTDNRPPVVEADVNSVKEDTAPNPISGNVLTNDSDPDGNTLSVTNGGTFTLTYGVLELHADGTYSYTLDNSNADVDALDSGETLTDSFTYSISDGHGGTNSSTLTLTIEGTSPNLAPVNTVPSLQSALRNNALVFSAAAGNALSVSDLDAGAADVQVTLSASSGAMTLSQTTGLTFTLGDGAADTSFTFTGTIADINAALEGLEIVSGSTGAISIEMTTNDLGNTGSGGAKVDVDIISIKVKTNVVEGNSKDDRLRGTALNDELIGHGGNDVISGGFGDDIIRGGGGNDKLYSWRGNDTIDGGAGDDRIMSGRGADVLTGGAGADVFVFRRASSTQPTVPDHATITDFSIQERDRIDISFIDANENRPGNQAFAFIGTDAFSGKAGELRVEESGGHTFVYGDTNGDGTAELVIELSSAIALRARHFDL